MSKLTSHSESLDLIDEFLRGTSNDILESLKKEVLELNIQSLTIDQYFELYQDEYENFNNFLSYSEDSPLNEDAWDRVNFSQIGVYQTTDCNNYFVPPNIEIIKENEKKDLVDSTGSFFLLYLYHGRI